MRHITLYEDYSDQELKSLRKDTEDLGISDVDFVLTVKTDDPDISEKDEHQSILDWNYSQKDPKERVTKVNGEIESIKILTDGDSSTYINITAKLLSGEYVGIFGKYSIINGDRTWVAFSVHNWETDQDLKAETSRKTGNSFELIQVHQRAFIHQKVPLCKLMMDVYEEKLKDKPLPVKRTK